MFIIMALVHFLIQLVLSWKVSNRAKDKPNVVIFTVLETVSDRILNSLSKGNTVSLAYKTVIAKEKDEKTNSKGR